MELLTALLICMAYKHYGTGFAAIYYTLLICILIAAAAIDIEHMIIPDGLLLTGCSAALCLIFWCGDILCRWNAWIHSRRRYAGPDCRCIVFYL